MREIENTISSLVKTQFPEFYLQEGPRFVDFVQQYYAWMETTNQATNRSRNLFNYRDVDKTSQEFVQYFKKKYLDKFPLTSLANTQLLTKHALDIYGSKGTDRGVQLVMRAMFNQPAQVHYPSKNLLKASDGTWVKPVYLELSISDRTKQFVGKEILGNQSGAKAFLETLVKKRINSRYVEVAYLSNVRGNFTTGEYITTVLDTDLTDAPVMIGSMTTLSVVGGGANFSIGDIFDVASPSGKQGKARVTEINNETGKVTFIYTNPLDSGGWGYSIAHSNVVVASKMLQVANVYNVNTAVTSFQQFENVTQTFANIAYNTARPNNANFSVGSTIENYYANGSVAANATIVAVSSSNATDGYIVVAQNVGNVSAVDTTFAIKGTGTQATFNANSGVANTTEFITTTSTHTFVNGDILVYSTLTGNTALAALSTGAAYYVVGANSTALQLSDTLNGTAIDLTAGLNQTGHVLTKALGSGVIASYADRTATATLMQANSAYVGVVNVSSNGFIITPYANVVGVLSNTTAIVANVSTGTGAAFSVGLLTDTESVMISPDMLSNVNTQNVVFSSINLNGNNSGAGLQFGVPVTLSTSDTAYGGFGFPKFTTSTLDSTLLDCIRMDSTILGSIAGITSINPGSDYNVDPFVVVVDTWVSGYYKHDYLMLITPTLGGFVRGEQIRQTYDLPATQLTVNSFSGTAANGDSTTSVILSEKIYQSYANGADRAVGFVNETSIAGGSGTIKLVSVTGTFVNTTNTSTQMKSFTTGGTANITLVESSTVPTTARAIVREVVSPTLLKLKRINLENTFLNGSTILGQVSGAIATIDVCVEDLTVPAIGVNANIVANVQTANNVATKLAVYDSGFGYNNLETVTLSKPDSVFEITAIVELGKQGTSEGFYSSTKGFLDSDKKLHDNDYYQEYSYEVITKIPFDTYVDVLKQLMHVAGTKAFGRVDATSVVNTNMTVINSITIS